MSRSLTPKDAHALMNALVHQATGQTNLAVVDTSTFVSAGETVLATGMENTLNSLSIVMGNLFMAVRPYTAKLTLIQAKNTDLYTSRMRKISFYPSDNVEAGDWNTDLNTANLYNGYDNNAHTEEGKTSVASMWEQHKKACVEINFAGQSVWDFPVTIYENQMKVAFRSEEEFIKFVNGLMVENANDIESTKEAWNRMIILNALGGCYDMNNTGSVRNLTKEYNDKFGTHYTSAELRTTYLESFLKFFVSEFKLASNYMEERKASYHYNPTKVLDGITYNKVMRHTGKADQRVLLYNPLFIEAQSNVLPTIFNPQFLDVGNFEGVDYWQSSTDGERASIKVTPAIPDTANGAQKAGNPVSLDYVIGMIFDKDALMTDFQFQSADSTPLEARKRYRNVWYHNSKNAICDFSENMIMFIMKDGD